MISYEDARRFREDANAPLTWDETISPPPRDRIEFTRLILEAAEEAGLGLPVWNEQFSYDNRKGNTKQLIAFQKKYIVMLISNILKVCLR